MDPVAFSIGPLSVRWYSIMASAGMLSCFFMGHYWAGRYGIDQDKFDVLTLVLMPAVILGGRTAYVLDNLPYYRQFPGEILRVDHGGLGSHGAITAVLITGYLAVKALNLRFWDTADALSPALPLSYLFVRLGNFANGELYGLPTSLPWGIVFPGTLEPRHPSMLYEAAGEVIILILTLRWCASRRVSGGAFLQAGIAMSILRVLVDFTRSGGQGPVLGLGLTQLLSLLMGAACLVLLARRRSLGRLEADLHR